MEEDLRNVRSCVKRSGLGLDSRSVIKKNTRKCQEGSFSSFAKRLKQAHAQNREIFHPLPGLYKKNCKLEFDSKNCPYWLKLKNDVYDLLVQLEAKYSFQNLFQNSHLTSAILDGLCEIFFNSSDKEPVYSLFTSNNTLKITVEDWKIDLTFDAKGNVDHIKLLTLNDKLFSLCIQNMDKLRRVVRLSGDVCDLSLEIALESKITDQCKNAKFKFHSNDCSLQEIALFAKQEHMYDEKNCLSLIV
jgi:hypothetical protein